MTYLQQLTDSLTTEHHQVPFIYNPPELEMEHEVNGYDSMYEIFSQSIYEHLSSIPEYECRICNDKIEHSLSASHLDYGSTYIFNTGIDLLSEHIYGCCESCSHKIGRLEMNPDGTPYVKEDP